MAHLTLRGIALRDYTFDLNSVIIFGNCFVLLVPPWTTLLFAPTRQQQIIYVQDYGDLDCGTGYWAVEEETGQEGFVQ